MPSKSLNFLKFSSIKVVGLNTFQWIKLFCYGLEKVTQQIHCRLLDSALKV